MADRITYREPGPCAHIRGPMGLTAARIRVRLGPSSPKSAVARECPACLLATPHVPGQPGRLGCIPFCRGQPAGWLSRPGRWGNTEVPAQSGDVQHLAYLR